MTSLLSNFNGSSSLALIRHTFLFAFSFSVLVANTPINISARLELFIDDHLIAETEGDVQQQLIEPTPGKVVFVMDEPWEGNTSGYFTFFQDGDIYRMIYRGWQHDSLRKQAHPAVTCYAESKDGMNWVKPKLGLFEWEGSKENNIILMGPGSHNLTAFRDDNPAAPESSRYKAVGRTGRAGLLAYESPDCKNWKLIRKESIITNGAFDSQNLAFWDSARKEYRAYWRYFGKGIRSIRTATSRDFLNWSNEADLTYPAGTPREHLYTNAIQKYYRASHLFLGFPTRYEAKSQQVEPILMISRDGTHFRRYADPVIPRTAPKNRDTNRGNYMAWGMFPTPGKPNEISVYGTENYYASTPGRIRHFSYRVDGFVALRSGVKGGRMITRKIKYEGDKLLLNYVTQKGGSVQVMVRDLKGRVIGRSVSLNGDAVDEVVKWEQMPKLNGSAIQLEFQIKNADVYSLRFSD